MARQGSGTGETWLSKQPRRDVKLASLLSFSRSCLRAALIDLDKSPRKTFSSRREYSTFQLRATDVGIQRYVHTQKCPHISFFNIQSYRKAHSAVRKGAYASYSLENSGAPPVSTSQRLVAAEASWLQPDDSFQHDGLLEWTDPTPTRRFDWRKRFSSRAPFVFSTPDKRKSYPYRKSPILPTTCEGEPYFTEIFNYQKHFLPLLESEEANNRNEVQERLSSWTLGKLKREGYCLTDVFGYWSKVNQFGKPVAAFQFGPGLELPENHKFLNGTQVMMSKTEPLKGTLYRGSVVERSDTQIKVAFSSAFDIGGPWRLDLGETNLIFERMRTAISALHYDLNYLEEIPRSADQEYILLGTGLKDILLRSGDPSRTLPSETHEFHALQDPDDTSYPTDALSHGARELSPKEFEGIFSNDMRIRSWAERYLLDDPLVVEGDPVLNHLNKSQIKAMATMIGRRISLVQGPPGTGKTKTIVETIKLLRNHFEVPYPILVCTYTNVAVDNLLEGFVKIGLKPLRVGFNTRIREPLQQYSLDYLLETHPLRPLYKKELALFDKLEDQINQLAADTTDIVKKLQKEPNNDKLKKRAGNMYRALAAKDREQTGVKHRMYKLQQEMLHDIIKSADVVCTTCITAASSALNVSDFPVVFIDEASMSTEPATLIPIMKGSRHLALIGDHKQLPPVIVSREAQLQGLGVSLFERLTEEGIAPSVMLDIQYRMHPSISSFPSWEFYNNSIQDGTRDREGNVVSGLEPPLSATHTHLEGETTREGRQRSRPSVIFLDHRGFESMSGRSRVNNDEAQIVVSLVEDLLLQNPQLRGQDIGVIAPYVAQINLLTRLLSTDDRHKVRFQEVLGTERCQEMQSVEVKTVDGFEGREKDIIIFSTVRNNTYGKIGFLADRRRLNVGLTRAKRGLFVVGSMRTLGEPGAVGTTPPPTSTSDTVVSVKRKRGNAGADSWKRYAMWLAQEGLVLKLVGEKLHRTLYGNLRKRAIGSPVKLKG